MFNRIRWQRSGLLQDADFLKVWAAETISQFGSQISIFAVPLIAAITLDASPLQMGILSAAGPAPRLAIGFFAGAWADRLPRRPIMIFTNLGRMVASAMIPLAALSGDLTFAILLAIAVITGMQSVFFDTAWAALLPNMVGKKHLTDATSKLMGSASLAQVVGPALGGLIVGLFGGPQAMWIPAITFSISAMLLMRIHTPEIPPERPQTATSMWTEVREGLTELWREPVVLALMNSSIVLNFGGAMFLAVYVLFMTNDLELSSQGIGLVFASGGIGALIGTIVAPILARKIGVGPSILAGSVGFGVANLPVPLAFYFPDIALPVVVFGETGAWLSLMVVNVNRFALRQALTPNKLRGRIAASSITLVSGAAMIGSLTGGLIGEIASVHTALYVSIVFQAAAALWVWKSPVPGIIEFPEDDLQPTS